MSRTDSSTDVVVIIPSRGRPAQCVRLTERVRETARGKIRIVVSVELDDVKPYARALNDQGGLSVSQVTMVWDQAGLDDAPSHVSAMNRAARAALAERFIDENEPDPTMIVKMDDDHWPLTIGWDVQYLAALDRLGGTGVVYGNDLLQGERLPTVPGISANIVRELGWFAPPALGHLYCDNFWLELGRRSGRIQYLPDVHIEHRHPDAGKGQPDQTYADGGQNRDRWRADEAAWREMIRVSTLSPISDMEAWARKVARLAEREVTA